MLSTQSLQFKRFCFAFVLIAGFAVPVAGMADAHASMPSGDASIVSPDAKLELLFSDAFFTEGAAVARMVASISVTLPLRMDQICRRDHIWRYDPQDRNRFRVPLAERDVQRHQV